MLTVTLAAADDEAPEPYHSVFCLHTLKMLLVHKMNWKLKLEIIYCVQQIKQNISVCNITANVSVTYWSPVRGLKHSVCPPVLTLQHHLVDLLHCCARLFLFFSLLSSWSLHCNGAVEVKGRWRRWTEKHRERFLLVKGLINSEGKRWLQQRWRWESVNICASVEVKAWKGTAEDEFLYECGWGSRRFRDQCCAVLKLITSQVYVTSFLVKC